MVDSTVMNLLAGLILGFLAGLGVGGGTLLILWLTMVVGLDGSIARAINLLFFIAAAGAVSLVRWRKGCLELKAVLPAVICGCVMAALFSWLRGYIPSELAGKLFGILLLLTGLRELFYRPRKAR